MSRTVTNKRRSRLKDNYIRIRKEAPNSRGYKDEWAYSGPWIRWTCADGDPVRIVKLVSGLSLLQSVLLLFGSLHFFLVNWYPIVTALKVLSLVPLVFQLAAVVRIYTTRKSRMTVMDSRSAVKELRMAPFVFFAVMICVFIAQLIELIIHFQVLSVIALAASAGSGAISFLVGKKFRLLGTKTEKNDIKRGLKELNDKATGLGTGIYVPRHSRK